MPNAASTAALRRLSLLAAVVLSLTAATPFAFRGGGDNVYMVFAIATGLVAMAATRVAERAPEGAALWLIIGVAVLIRGALLFADPYLSTDIFRYVWDGRVQAAGINPYRYFPSHEALASLRDTVIYPKINRPDYAVTIYPPVAQMFFFLVTRFGENVTTMKLALLICEGTTVAVIALLLRKLQQPVTRLVAYAWHPLPIWEISSSGHIDALTTALMMVGIWFLINDRAPQGAVSIAVGALAKPFSIPALASAWRPWDWRVPALAALVAGLCYLPYVSVGWGVFGFLTAGYLREEGLDTGGSVWALAAWRAVAGILPGDHVVYLVGSVLVLAAMAFAAAWRAQQVSIQVRLADISRLLIAFLLLISPNYPWYFLVITPFVSLIGGLPLWALTLGAILLQEEYWGDPQMPLLLRKSIICGVFLAACAYDLWRRRRERIMGERQA